MGRKENEKVGIFNCHGMGGNQVNSSLSLFFFLSASSLGENIAMKTITVKHDSHANNNKVLA